MSRPADPLSVLTTRPVPWPLPDLREAARHWLESICASEAPAQFGAPPESLPDLLARLRLGPFEDAPGRFGLWWHENPARRPITVERLEEADRDAYLGSRRVGVDDLIGEEDGLARVRSVLQSARDVVGFQIYSGDQGGPGFLAALALAAAIAEAYGGIIETWDQYYAVEQGLVLLATGD